MLFFIAAAPFCFPTNRAQKLLFLLVHICLCSLDNSHPDRCETVAYCSFICSSFMSSGVELIFLYLLAICTLSLGNIDWSPWLIFKCYINILFNYYSIVGTAYIFWRLPFIRYVVCKYFLPSHGVAFAPQDCFFAVQTLFSYLFCMLFLFMFWVILVSHPLNHCSDHITKLSPYLFF